MALLLVVVCRPAACRFRRGAPHGQSVYPLRPSSRTYPLPLPRKRIDLRRTPPVEHPPSCRLFKLPPELREHIYEEVLGGRWIKLALVKPPHPRRRWVVRSHCYETLDNPESSKLHIITADKIPVALLLTCRQVYLEALPILHRRNTFHIDSIHEFEPILLSSLGHYCLADIRRVHMCRRDALTVPWAAAFSLLQEMRLHSLVLEFGAGGIENSELSPHSNALDTEWGRGVLAIRTLRQFDLLFEGFPPEHQASIGQRFQRLLIGSGADERYAVFLREYEQRIKSEAESPWSV